MMYISQLLFISGILTTGWFTLLLIIQAFRESVLWGLGFLLVPFVNFIFVFMNWDDDEVRGAFLKSLIGFPLIVMGILLSAG